MRKPQAGHKSGPFYWHVSTHGQQLSGQPQEDGGAGWTDSWAARAQVWEQEVTVSEPTLVTSRDLRLQRAVPLLILSGTLVT